MFDNPLPQLPDLSILDEMDEFEGLEELPFKEDRTPTQHNANLAEGDYLSEDALSKISNYIIDAVEDDIASRSEWEMCLKDSVRLLGNKIERKSWPFKNASGVWDPIMMQAVLTFQATAYPELLPPDGPIKTDIMGDENEMVLDIAQRQEEWGNFFLTQIAQEYYPDFDHLLFYTPLMGCSFKKVYQDSVRDRPVLPFIKPQDFVVNYGTTSLETCSRITQIIHFSEKEIRGYQESGFYRNINLQNSTVDETSNQLTEIINENSGMKPGDDEYNKEYKVYESHIDLDLNDFLGLGEDQIEFKDKTFLPYIITIAVESKKILSIYRNWEEFDDEYKKIQYFIDYQFIRGLGFYGYGYAHILGNQAHTATAIMRQLIDAGMLANFPGGIRSKGMQLETDTLTIGPGQFAEVETGGLPLQQSIMPLPYKEPSQTLYNLLEKVEDNAGKLAGSANLQVADFNINAPVGTTLALLEQTQKLQSTIMRRMHQSMRQEFRLLYQLFKKHMVDEPYKFLGKKSNSHISRQDFIDSVQLIPVSDPNSNSSTHRLVKYESILRLASQFPQIHDMRQIYELIYRELKIANIDKILPKQEEMMPLDPVTENMHAMKNMPMKAAIWQDHQAHIMVHQQLLMQGPNPVVEAHIQEHMAFDYLLNMQQMMGMELPQQVEQLPPELQNQIAMAAAQAVQQMQQEQQQQNPPPLDPALVMLEDVKMQAKAKAEEVKVKVMGIEQKSESDTLKARTEAFKAQKKFQVDKAKLDFEKEKFNLTGQ
jgi:hypothetical protein